MNKWNGRDPVSYPLPPPRLSSLVLHSFYSSPHLTPTVSSLFYFPFSFIFLLFFNSFSLSDTFRIKSSPTFTALGTVNHLFPLPGITDYVCGHCIAIFQPVS